MELAVLIRRTTLVGAVAYLVIMFPPIRTTYTDIGVVNGKPSASVESSRAFLGMIPPSSASKDSTVGKVEIEWPRYLVQLAAAPVVGFFVFRRRRPPLACPPGD